MMGKSVVILGAQWGKGAWQRDAFRRIARAAARPRQEPRAG